MKVTKRVEKVFVYCDVCGEEVDNGYTTITVKTGEEYHACNHNSNKGQCCRDSLRGRIRSKEVKDNE